MKTFMLSVIIFMKYGYIIVTQQCTVMFTSGITVTPPEALKTKQTEWKAQGFITAYLKVGHSLLQCSLGSSWTSKNMCTRATPGISNLAVRPSLVKSQVRSIIEHFNVDGIQTSTKQPFEAVVWWIVVCVTVNSKRKKERKKEVEIIL